MAKSLLEYADWLDERGLLWPAPPAAAPAKIAPQVDALPEIRAVTWGLYGTLLLATDGRLLPIVSEPLRMEVALEKTIHEFNMWNSMSRKPGAPWEYMLYQFQRVVETLEMAGSEHKGEAPEVNLAHVWRKLIERLQKKEYVWDEKNLGGLDAFSEKVAYYFQSCLQGLCAAPHALQALVHVRESGCEQGIVADGQAFSLVQLVRALRAGDNAPALTRLISRGCVSLSYQFRVKQPSGTLFKACLAGLKERGISPPEVLHVASRVREELGPARRLGMRTALFAGDKRSLQATSTELNDPTLRPDRILTNLRQMRQIVPTGG